MVYEHTIGHSWGAVILRSVRGIMAGQIGMEDLDADPPRRV